MGVLVPGVLLAPACFPFPAFPLVLDEHLFGVSVLRVNPVSVLDAVDSFDKFIDVEIRYLVEEKFAAAVAHGFPALAADFGYVKIVDAEEETEGPAVDILLQGFLVFPG